MIFRQLFRARPSLSLRLRPSLPFSSVNNKNEMEKLQKDPQTGSPMIPNINKPNITGKDVIESVEREMTRDEISVEFRRREQQLHHRHDLLRIDLRKKVNLPFQLCGLNRKTYNESYAYLPDRVMAYYRIKDTTITSFLLKIYKASLYSMIDNNTAFMEEYWEEGFKNGVLSSLQTHKESGYKLKLVNQKKYLDEAEETCQIVDSVMIRGLSVDRKENEHPKAYKKYEEEGEVGLMTFTPHYLTEYGEQFVNPESNKNMYAGYDKMVLRVAVRIRSPLKLVVEGLDVPEELNTYEHLVVFENQMIPPKPMESRYKLQTLMEWLGKYSFGVWRIVDMDNFMLGNSPFRNHVKEEPMDEIFANSPLDKSYFCNIRRF